MHHRIVPAGHTADHHLVRPLDTTAAPERQALRLRHISSVTPDHHNVVPDSGDSKATASSDSSDSCDMAVTCRSRGGTAPPGFVLSSRCISV